MNPDPPPPYPDTNTGRQRRRQRQRDATIVYESSELKSLKTIRRLVWTEFILSLVMVLCDSIVDGVISSSDWFPDRVAFPCTGATGIYVGVLGVMSAGLGFVAFWNRNGKIYLTYIKLLHFIMSVGIAVADVFLLRFAIVCVVMLNPPSIHSSNSTAPAHKNGFGILIGGMTAAESILLVVAFAHFICSIVSTGFICRRWCRKNEPSYTLYYRPNQPQGAQGNGTDPAAQVPLVQLDGNGRRVQVDNRSSSA